MNKGRLWQVVKLTVLYVVFGSVWILISDQVLLELFPNRVFLFKLQTLKGWFFIAITALLFFLVTSSYEKKLSDTRELLHKKNRDLKVFFERMSHDLRGPMATILGLTNIGKNMPEKDGAPAILDRIELTAKKSDKIIRELIKLTSIIDRDVKLKFVNAQELMAEIIKEERLQTMEQEWPEVYENVQPVAIETDERLLSFALHEIINNAIQYQKNTASHKVTIHLERMKRQQLLITIRDNGIGISEKEVKRIHELFYRGLSSKGAGIGLYTAGMAIEKLHGSLKIRSTAGIGATFTILLPCRSSPLPV